MDIIPKKKKSFVNKDDIIENKFDVLRKILIAELKEKEAITLIKRSKDTRIILGQMNEHGFLLSQLHNSTDFILIRTFYITDKFRNYVKEGREEEIL